MAAMTEKHEAVTFLKGRSFHAFERDWAMGETVGVAAEPTDSGIDGITAYKRMVYMVRAASGWTVVDLNSPPSGVSDVMTLTEACARAEAILMSPPTRGVVK